jgi:hypothetical protein
MYDKNSLQADNGNKITDATHLIFITSEKVISLKNLYSN